MTILQNEKYVKKQLSKYIDDDIVKYIVIPYLFIKYDVKDLVEEEDYYIYMERNAYLTFPYDIKKYYKKRKWTKHISHYLHYTIFLTTSMVRNNGYEEARDIAVNRYKQWRNMNIDYESVDYMIYRMINHEDSEDSDDIDYEEENMLAMDIF